MWSVLTGVQGSVRVAGILEFTHSFPHRSTPHSKAKSDTLEDPMSKTKAAPRNGIFITSFILKISRCFKLYSRRYPCLFYYKTVLPHPQLFPVQRERRCVCLWIREPFGARRAVPGWRLASLEAAGLRLFDPRSGPATVGQELVWLLTINKHYITV